MWVTLTLRFWQRGRFNVDRNGVMIYLGGQGKTFQCDADELCYWDLLEFAKKSGGYSKVEGVFYQVPGLSLQEGLRKVENDNDVFAMGEIGMKYRTVDLYVLHQDQGPHLVPSPTPEVQKHFQPLESEVQQPTRPKKLTPKKGPPKDKHDRPNNSQIETQFRSSPRLRDVVLLGTSSPRPHKSKLIKKPNTATEVHATSQTSSSFFPTNPEKNNLNTDNNKASASQPPFRIPNNNQPSTPLAHFDQTEIFQTQQSNCNDYEWVDNRPDSPLAYNQLVSDSGEDSEDPLYQPEKEPTEEEFTGVGEEGFVEDENIEAEEDDVVDPEIEEIERELAFEESDNSDEEYILARTRVRHCNSKLLDIAQQLQREAAEGKLTGQQPKLKQPITAEEGEGGDGYESVYYDSEDDLDTPPGSEDDCDVGRRTKRNLLVGVDTDFTKFQWRVGQRFTCREDFKQAVSKYAIMQGRNLGVVVSNKDRRQELGVKCQEGCPFYLFASWHSKKASYIVKRVVCEHQCQRNMKRNKQMTTRWVAKEMLEVFKARPHWPAKEIKETIKRAYRTLVSNDFAYKVKYKAHLMLHGSMQDHYNKVGNYIAACKQVSLGTVVELVVDPSKNTSPPIFQRLFTCFDGLKRGWKEGCRPIICVDAAFLKTFLGGQILAAVGRDANDQMFPIAWAVVEGENNESWGWFFNHLRTCLQLGDGSGIAVVSDEHQAILSAVASVLPEAEHRHCARHVYAHWKRFYRGDEMKLAFWKIAKAYSMADYNEALEELNQSNPAAATAFRAYTPANFCRAFMNPSIKCDAITNNMAETFNGYIVNARTKHLLFMLEDIRGALMQRVCTKRKEMEKKPTLLCPRIQNALNKEKAFVALCEVIPSTENIFNVSYYLDTLVVDLGERSCTCRKWDLVGIPCCHAIACIYFLNREAEEFVDDCYKREVYLKSYANPIPAIAGERHWPKLDNKLDPPPIKVGPGRPRKNRIRDPFEDPKRPGALTRHGMEMTCSLCSRKGHNKRGCPDKDTVVAQAPQPKKARGRPRKYGDTTTDGSNPTTHNHHTVSAQPTQLGRGGRMILGGVGARGGSCGRGRASGTSVGRATSSGLGRASGSGGGGRAQTRGGGGRAPARGGSGGGGRAPARGGSGRGNGRGRGRGQNQVPIGVGVTFGSDGTPLTTVNDGNGRLRTVNMVTNRSTQPSQRSTMVNNTQ